ncbi:hypothetical protein [Halobacillus sp. Cin3]|uniref:hypothetical protein n=1 Tax=Halobacillus sp. Cin3 TaxID=2928441 RepID=UPI00248D8B05|nr:hypothetical protein [Halobacillus sp. Cin3]
MEFITLDSGFGYDNEYPCEDDLNVLFTINQEHERFIFLNYTSVFRLRKVLQSEIHSVDDHAKSFLLSNLQDISNGKFDTKNERLLRLYS